jgi:aspartyl/asparaginyl beta-hydroxylase (cupin superfamily)
MASHPHTAQFFQIATDAQARGDGAGFARALESVLSVEPENPRALNSLGNFWLNNGKVADAVSLLTRAVAADATVPALWFNLALAHKAAGDSTSEIAALDQALALDPYFLHALVHKAVAYEKAGKQLIAARLFRNALESIGDDIASAPAPLQPQLQHGRTIVAAHQNALFAHLENHLKPLRSELSGAQATRFAESLEIFSGRQKYRAQEPTFYAYPGLPPLAFFERADFPWLDALEDVWRDIRDEMQQAMEQRAEFVPYIARTAGSPLNQWAELNNSDRWGAYYLYRLGERIEDHAAACPVTLKALSHAPQPHVINNAPNAFFSHLKPHTHIPAHTGMTNTRLVVHLPLVVPEGCVYRVGNDVRKWQEGKAWVFDDTINHEARNDSDQSRTILLFDIWNPLLGDAEQRLVAEAIKAHMDFYGGADGAAENGALGDL